MGAKSACWIRSKFFLIEMISFSFFLLFYSLNYAIKFYKCQIHSTEISSSSFFLNFLFITHTSNFQDNHRWTELTFPIGKVSQDFRILFEVVPGGLRSQQRGHVR